MMDEIETIKKSGMRPKLLLHSCCAPCSSHVLMLLSDVFELEVLFFNPNIYPEEEYERRRQEQVRLIEEMGLAAKVLNKEAESTLFYEAVKGFEHLKEGSERCHRCFRLRLERVAQYAKENGFEYFTTTLTISPLKNAGVLNAIGLELGEQYQISFLSADFKKNDGYRQSVILSKQYHLYRQDYCGCVFSKKERETHSKHI
jgi:predicted adenine nucleotide alpha hydrolase (AANH) superfamily ATPase